ncbi:MAG: leucine-rich repeat protein, partial [Bacillota bacterium]
MNKYLRLVIVAVLIFLATGLFVACESGPMITEIEVDQTTVSEEYDVSDFEISSIMLIVTYEDEQTESIPLDKTMIKAEDQVKFAVPGDHTITITYKQRSTTFTLKMREGISGKYTVIFQNQDEEQIGQTQYIEPGGTAESPPIPTKADHIFDGWVDQNGNFTFYDNIYEDKVYTATFVPDFCVVRFILPNGNLIEEVTVKKGESAEDEAPDFPVIAGETAIGWNRSLDEISEDITITAVYVEENINATFVYGGDGRQPRVANFPANTEITPPVSPQVSHSEFLGWYTNESFEGEKVDFPYLLQNEITFYAKYVSRTQGSPDLEYSYTGSNSYTISDYTGDDDVIVIPEKYNNLDVVGVENRAFENADNLRFYVTDSNNYFSISDGVLFDVTNERLIAYPSGRESNTYDVPVGVSYIEDYAFAKAGNLMVLNFSGENLLSIGDYAFYNCSQLVNVSIPVSVETIGNYAFHMDEDTSLTTLTFALNSILQQIGDGAFSGLNRLTEITLPSSRLETIGSSVFSDCSMLERIEIEEGSNDYFTSIDGALYNNSITTLVAYPANNDLNERAYYVVPDGVETIRSGAFSYPNIVGVRLPETINNIEGFAFNSPRLQFIQFLGEEPPEIMSEILFGDYNPEFIVVPDNFEVNYDYFSDYTIVEGSPASSYNYDSSTGYLYTMDNDEKLTLWGARNYLEEMIIPSSVDGYDVKTIGK